VPLPDGGLVLWCRLPADSPAGTAGPVSSTAVAAAARTVGVVLTPGPRFSVDGGLDTRLRIPFSRPAEQLVAAVDLLARAAGRPVDADPGAVAGASPDAPADLELCR
jgi:DNA-binding transcriptional MocR family regulator